MPTHCWPGPDPAAALGDYGPSQLAPTLRPTVRHDLGTIRQVRATRDPLARSDREFWDLLAFRHALTSVHVATHAAARHS